MAKGYTFTDISQPTGCSASAVAGGSLAANTTYYYRIYKVATASSGDTWMGKSLPSDEFSVTTTSTNKTARITFTCPNESRSYRIFRATSSGGMINGYYPCIAFYPSDALYNSGGTVTFDDTGYAAGGNNFMEVNDNAHGRLVLSGSTSSDKFSIVDLYNADVAAGWGVIIKLSDNCYKVNCYLVGHTGLYWQDTEKTIIFADGFDQNYSGSYWYFGNLSGTSVTSQGCNIIVKSSWLSSVVFPTIYAYRTTFVYLFPRDSSGADMTNNLGLVGGGFRAGLLQDCTVDRWRNFAPYSAANCTFRNHIMSRFDNAFDSIGCVYDTVKMLSGYRVWQISGSSTNFTARNLYVERSSIVLLIGATGSSLTVVNTPVPSSGGMISNSDSAGFKLYDQFSFDLNVVDEIGNAIEDATVEIYDTDDALIVDATTDSNGDVTQEEITRVEWTKSAGTGTSATSSSRYPFTIRISKDGYETYEEIVSYASSYAVVKTVALKQSRDIMFSTKGQVFAKVDATNNTEDRELLIPITG